MAGWRFFHKTDRSIDRIGYWAGVFGPGGLLATLMTWAASAFEPIARYGWDGIVIAGVVLGCFVVLTIAAGLIAWRQFNPLPASPGSTNALSNEASISEGHAVVSGQIQKLQERLEGLTRAMGELERAKHQTFEGFQAELSELKNRLSKIDDSLRPKERGLLALGSGQNYETRLDAIEAMVQSARDSIKGAVDSLLHTMDQRKLIQDQLNEAMLTSLRARDALEILQTADAKAVGLGEKLISAETYENGAAWSVDHNQWGHHLSIIDGLIAQWFGDKHQDLIDLKHYHYESEKRTAPPHILADESENYRRYKHVCISHDRYLNVRRDAFAYFKSKAHDLPR